MNNRYLQNQRGSAILLVVILTTAIAIVIGSLMRYAMFEKRANHDARLRMEARNAAEAVAEYGFAQLVVRFNAQSSFPQDALAPNKNPLTIPQTFFDFYKADSNTPGDYTNVVLGNGYDPTKPWGTHETEIVGGIVPPGEWRFIDPNIPGNENDRLKGRKVFVRAVNVYSRATVQDPRNPDRTHTAYSSQELQVRDAPLFANAIFYNMDMEIAPGALMTVNGAVHVNGNVYVQSNNGLTFNRSLSATGDLFHGRAPNSGQSSATGDVLFPNASGQLTSLRGPNPVNGQTIWLDSKLDSWGEVAANRFGGNVLTADHNVQPQQIVQIPDYVRDDPATSTRNDALNYAYQLIMRPSNQNDPNFNAVVEEEKFSVKAGLVIDVTYSGNNPNYRLYTYDRDSSGGLKYDSSGQPIRNELTVLNQDIFQTQRFASQGSGSNVTVTSGMHDKRRNKNLDILQIDVGKLKEMVEKNDQNDWGGNSAQKPENWWNGVVYVNTPHQSGSAGKDNVIAARDNFGVKLVNGQEIPNPTFAQNSDIYGMTLATNNALYVHGHFNADGNSNTGSETKPDKSTEPPAALVADAVTFLSTNWSDANSLRPLSNRVAASFTEVSAAILTGLVPTNKVHNVNSYSGGVENFPRFLEDWGSGRTFRYRGSLVAMFESEIATQPWGQGDVYAAPNRNWGFHEKFAEGYYPPGTPNTRTYRRINFRDLAKAEYEAALQKVKQDMAL